MYAFLIFVHSWLRWLILILLLATFFKSFFSFLNNRPFTKTDKTLSIAFLSSVHMQFLGGLALYFGVSPLVKMGLTDMKTTMHNSVLRYWTVEHIASMFIVVVLAQVGYSCSKRATITRKKHQYLFVFCTLILLILFAMLPWPYKEYGRPLFRFF